MAQKVTTVLTDDLTGEESDGVTSVDFAIDGVAYEIDLDETNAKELREDLADFVASARKLGRYTVGGDVKRARSASTATAARPAREQSKAVRDWAKGQGYEISERGRIPGNVQEAFDNRHAG